MRYNKSISIEPAANGYIVTFEEDDTTEVRVFGKRRALMHHLGKLIDQLESSRKFDMDEPE
jgi:hypothetical protein